MLHRPLFPQFCMSNWLQPIDWQSLPVACLANKLGGLSFAGDGSKWSIVQPRSIKANPLSQPMARDLGSISSHKDPNPIRDAARPWKCSFQPMPSQGHHARRPPTTVFLIVRWMCGWTHYHDNHIGWVWGGWVDTPITIVTISVECEVDLWMDPLP